MKLETTVTMTIGDMAKLNEVALLLGDLVFASMDEEKGLDVASKLWDARDTITRVVNTIEEVRDERRYNFSLEDFIQAF